MNAASPGAPSDETGARSTGPGHLLRTARESAGMGVREVSAQLRLDERLVMALESDDFAELPAPTFVRGYLRGYARLLGVPVGPVMEAYDREGFNPPDLVADIAETPDASTRDVPVRLASLGVVAALVVLVVLWWNNQAFNDMPAPVPAAPESAPGTAAAPPAAPAAPAAKSDGERTAEMQTGSVTRDESAAGALPLPAPAPPPTAADPNPPAPVPGEARTGSATEPAAPAARGAISAPAPGAREESADRVIARAENVLERTRSEVDAIVGGAGAASQGASRAPPAGSAPASAPTGAPETAGAAATPPPRASAGEPGHLVMRFPIESWVEVYDRAGERLYYNLAKPGQVVDVSGEPPIRILLGRTRGVTVTFNDESVDLAPFTERGVARMTLGR